MPAQCELCGEETEKEVVLTMPNEPNLSTPICSDCIDRGSEEKDLFGEEAVSDSLGVGIHYINDE